MEGVTSINKFKGVVEARIRIMNFSLQLIITAKTVTSFDIQKNKKDLKQMCFENEKIIMRNYDGNEE